MFEDYEGLKSTEIRGLIVRLTSTAILAATFPFCKFISPFGANFSLVIFVSWYLIQWPLLLRQISFEFLRRMGRFNFGFDLIFITAIVVNNGLDPYWAAYVLYVLSYIEGLICFEVRGGLLATIVSLIVTLAVCYLRQNDPQMHEPLYPSFFRLLLLLMAGLSITYTLSRLWTETGQSARTTALDALNRNLIASEGTSEVQLYRRIEAAVRNLMHANSFILALFPIEADQSKIKPGELWPAIVTINNQQLVLPQIITGWAGNELVRRSLAEVSPVQEIVVSTPTKTNDQKLENLPWFSQYHALPGTYLYAPIVIGDVLLGVMGVRKNSRRHFGLNNLALFEQLATLCGTALNNVRVANNRHRTISELALLNQISYDLTQTAELSDMVVKLRKRLQDFFGATNVRFVLGLAEESEAEPEVNLKVGSLEGITENGLRNVEFNLLQKLMERKENLLLADLSSLEKWTTGLEVAGRPSQDKLKGSYMAVPIIAEDESLGILAVHCIEPNRYVHSDLQLLETVAHQTAIVIQNLELQMQTLQNLEEVRTLYNILKAKDGELRHEAEERARFEGALMTARAIGHEIGQPLTSILGLTTLARSGVPLTPGDVEILVQETLHARNIIAKLRSVVRFETKPYADQTSMLDLDASSNLKENYLSSVGSFQSKSGLP